MALSKEEIEKIIEDKKDYTFCETCGFAIEKDRAFFVNQVCYLFGVSRHKIFFCENHKPSYDEKEIGLSGTNYYKNIPAKRIEIKLKK